MIFYNKKLSNWLQALSMKLCLLSRSPLVLLLPAFHSNSQIHHFPSSQLTLCLHCCNSLTLLLPTHQHYTIIFLEGCQGHECTNRPYLAWSRVYPLPKKFVLPFHYTFSVPIKMFSSSDPFFFHLSSNSMFPSSSQSQSRQKLKTHVFPTNACSLDCLAILGLKLRLLWTLEGMLGRYLLLHTLTVIAVLPLCFSFFSVWADLVKPTGRSGLDLPTCFLLCTSRW